MPYGTNGAEGRARRQGWIALTFLGAALLLRALPPSVQQDVAALVRGTLLRPFLVLQETVAQARVRALEVEALRVELDSLVAVLARQRTLAEENRRLRGLLELRDRAPATFRAVVVLRPGAVGSESMFLVDAGSEDGVVPGAPVITLRGLVGVVRDVGRRSSAAMDWTHPDFRAGAMTEDGEVFGIVEPFRGRFREEDRLLLNGTAYTDRVEPGDLIVTSGLGGVYPRGIPIGTVLEEAEAEAGWRRSYWLVPAVAPAGVTHAQVLVRSGEPADSLWEAVQEEARTTGSVRIPPPPIRTTPDPPAGEEPESPAPGTGPPDGEGE